MGWNNCETLQTASVLLKLLLRLSHLYRKFVTKATFRECGRHNRARSSSWQPSSKYELSRKTNYQASMVNQQEKCIIALLNVNSLPSKLIEIREWCVDGVFAILCIEFKIDTILNCMRMVIIFLDWWWRHDLCE